MTNSEHPSPLTHGVYELAHRALWAETAIARQAILGRSDTWTEVTSDDLRELAVADERFREWPEKIARSHHVAHTVSHYYDMTYWRINTGRLPLLVNPALPKEEQRAIAGLAEIILFSRVTGEPIDSTDYPCVPTPEELEDTWVDLHQQLDGDPDKLDLLPTSTFSRIVHSLVDGDIQLGR